MMLRNVFKNISHITYNTAEYDVDEDENIDVEQLIQVIRVIIGTWSWIIDIRNKCIR